MTFAAAAMLTVLTTVMVTVLMVVWFVCLFSGRVKKNVLAGWCLGFVLLLFFFFLSLQCACFFKMPLPPAQKISFVITWTEEEEGQQQEEELVVVLLVTKKREKEQGKKEETEKKGCVDGRACAFSHDICAC